MNKKMPPDIQIYHFGKPSVLHDSDIVCVGEQLFYEERDTQNEDYVLDVNNMTQDFDG